MNSKTTVFLALLLLGLVLGYVGLQRRTPEKTIAPVAPGGQADAGVARPLLAEPLGTIEKIMVRRGAEEWAFEKKVPKEGGAAVWHMVKPVEFKALGHEVDRIAREISKIEYEVSYKPGDGSISAQDAGLAPPGIAFTLSDDAGKLVTVEIGKPASDNETYVRKSGDDMVAVAKANFRKLLKARPIEYREQQLWNFPPEHVTHVEICETASAGSRDCMSFSRVAGGWAMEKPVAAKATSKVEDMVKAFARMRVSGWHDDDPSKLKMYGLDPGVLQIVATVEETVVEKAGEKEQAEGAEAPAEEPKTEKRVTRYNLQVADRGPIGEDTKVFIRSGDENAVATIFKATTDKLRPVLAEWRDMRVMTTDVMAATHMEIQSGDSHAVLVQEGGKWSFEGGTGGAESHAVTELLSAINNLKAVSFIEGSDAASADFDAPQVDIRLTVPGTDGGGRITVGSHTDPEKKLLVFVRSGDSGPVAKVKVADVATLLRPPGALRDHTVFQIPQDAIGSVAIARTMNDLVAEPQQFALAMENDIWSLVSPVRAAVRQEEVTKMIGMLSSLKANSVIGESTEESAYGLHEPAITVEFSVAVPAQDPAGSAPAQPAKKLKLLLAEHDGKIYGKQGDGGPIYELNKSLFDQLRAEFRTGDLLEFEAKDVQKVTLRSGTDSNSFVRSSGKWTLKSEPDFPIDSTKVENIVTEARALKTDRFAAYDSVALGQFALDPAQHELQFELSGSPEPRTITLRVSDRTVTHHAAATAATAGPNAPAASVATTASFATLSGSEGVFLLPSDAVKKIFVALGDLEKK